MKAVRALKRFFSLATGLVRKDPSARESARFLMRIAPAVLSRRRPRILYDRQAGLGDIICTFPAVLALRKKFPNCVIVYAVNRDFAAAVEFSGVADIVAPMPPQFKNKPGWCDRFFDQVHRPQLGDEKKTGTNRIHLVDDFAALARVTLSTRQPTMAVPDSVNTRVRERLRAAGIGNQPFVTINTGPSWRVREWTEAGWTQLAEWIHERPNLRIVQVGADVHVSLGVIRAFRLPGAIDLVGQLSLEESFACIQQSDLFVGIDSGLLHVAGAVGTPSVGIFGPTFAALRIPLETASIGVASSVPCLGCHHRVPILHWQKDCPYSIACMKELIPEQVIAACSRLLDGEMQKTNQAYLGPVDHGETLNLSN